MVSFTELAATLPLISIVYQRWGFDTLFYVLSAAAAVILALVSCLPRVPRLPRGGALLIALYGQIGALIGATLLGSFQEPLLWVHPFGPLTKNVSWLLGTVALLWFTKEENA